MQVAVLDGGRVTFFLLAFISGRICDKGDWRWSAWLRIDATYIYLVVINNIYLKPDGAPWLLHIYKHTHQTFFSEPQTLEDK